MPYGSDPLLLTYFVATSKKAKNKVQYLYCIQVYGRTRTHYLYYFVLCTSLLYKFKTVLNTVNIFAIPLEKSLNTHIICIE